MELEPCKLCGREVRLHVSQPDDSVSSGGASVTCWPCNFRVEEDLDQTGFPSIAGGTGWDANYAALEDAKHSVVHRWNVLNA